MSVSEPEVESTPEPEVQQDIYFVVDQSNTEEEREPVKYSYWSAGKPHVGYSRKEMYHIGALLEDSVPYVDNPYTHDTYMWMTNSTLGKILHEIVVQYEYSASAYVGEGKVEGDMFAYHNDVFYFDYYPDHDNYDEPPRLQITIYADPFRFVVYDVAYDRYAYGDANFYVDGVTVDE